MDATLRELEHALEASPEDGALRLRFASALAREGRRREAFDRLRAGPIGAEHRAAARALADELWLPDVARLEVAHVLRECGPFEVSHTLDLSKRLVAWKSWGQGAGLSVTDLETGETLFTDAAIREPWPVPVLGGFFVLDEERRLIRRLLLRDGRLEETSVPAVDDQDGVHASPAGDLVALTLGHRRLQRWRWEDDSPRPQATQTIARWPSLEPLLSITGYDNHFDWDSRVAFGRGPHVVMWPFDGGPTWTVEVGPSDRVEVLGPGILHDWLALTVIDVRGGPVLELVPGRSRRGSSSALDGFVSLSSDGRGLRVVTNGHAARFDYEPGRIVQASRDPAALTGLAGSDYPGPWHPHVDVFVSAGPVGVVHTLDATIGELPADVRPVAWVLDGEGLLVTHQVGNDRTRFEVWRVQR